MMQAGIAQALMASSGLRPVPQVAPPPEPTYAFVDMLRSLARAVVAMDEADAPLSKDARRSLDCAMDWAPTIAAAESFAVIHGNPIRMRVGDDVHLRGPTRGAAHRLASLLWAYRQYIPEEHRPSGPPSPITKRA